MALKVLCCCEIWNLQSARCKVLLKKLRVEGLDCEPNNVPLPKALALSLEPSELQVHAAVSSVKLQTKLPV